MEHRGRIDDFRGVSLILARCSTAAGLQASARGASSCRRPRSGAARTLVCALGACNGECADSQSVSRALGVLNLLAAVSEPLGVRAIARRLRLPPSTIQRLVKTLAKAGYLEQSDATLRYTIGYRAFQVGNAFVAQNSLISAVMPELYMLADHHITGFLGVLRDRSVVYLATVQSVGPIAITHRPGLQAHLHSTAMGKALLAEMLDDEVRDCWVKGPLPVSAFADRRSANPLPHRLCNQR
jgi:DNA-binding Lrp family transcriptional regulator